MNHTRKRPYEYYEADTDTRDTGTSNTYLDYNSHQLFEAAQSFIALTSNLSLSHPCSVWRQALCPTDSFPNSWEGEDGMMTHIKSNFPMPRTGAPTNPHLICDPKNLDVQKRPENSQTVEVVDKSITYGQQSITVSDDDDDDKNGGTRKTIVISDDDDDICGVSDKVASGDKEESSWPTGSDQETKVPNQMGLHTTHEQHGLSNVNETLNAGAANHNKNFVEHPESAVAQDSRKDCDSDRSANSSHSHAQTLDLTNEGENSLLSQDVSQSGKGSPCVQVEVWKQQILCTP